MAASASPLLIVRPYRASDQRRALELINTDRLVAQPVATSEMLEDALAGRSVVDAGWWSELDDLATEVLVRPRWERNLGQALATAACAAPIPSSKRVLPGL